MKYYYKGHKRTGYKLPFLKRNYTFFKEMHAAFCKQKTPSFAVTLFRRIVLFSPKASHFLLRLDSIWQFSLIFLFFFFFLEYFVKQIRATAWIPISSGFF